MQAVRVADPNLQTADTPISHHGLVERPLLAINIAKLSRSAAGGEALPAERWLRWAGSALRQVLSRHEGQIVRDTGTGLVMAFEDAHHCLQAAFALNQLADSLNAQADGSSQLHLHAVAHLAHLPCEQKKSLDRDMQSISALTTWAGPGEVLVTAELRDRLVNGLDADFEDLGHRAGRPDQMVRLFHARPRCSDISRCAVAVVGSDPRPGLAVMPFRADAAESMHWVIGELIAEGVVTRLFHSVGLRVISPRSTSALHDAKDLKKIKHHLGINFVFSGRYSIRNRRLVVTAELVELHSQTLLWTGQLQRALPDLFHEASELLHELARAVAQALGQAQLSRALSLPLPNLDSGHLMLASISMTHSHSDAIFERGRDAWVALTGRHPGHALPRAWLAMWHALNVIKGRSANVGRDIQQAREQALRALQIDPNHAMALAVTGYIQSQLLNDPQQARSHLTLAIEANPSEPMAWLFKSLYSASWGSSSLSVSEASFARNLSPVDPLQYFFDLLTGNAFIANHQLKQAIAYGRQSLKANKHHIPTLRLLLTAHTELGQIDEGLAVLYQLRSEAPDLTVSSYLSMGSAENPLRQRVAKAMQQLGLP